MLNRQGLRVPISFPKLCDCAYINKGCLKNKCVTKVYEKLCIGIRHYAIPLFQVELEKNG